MIAFENWKKHLDDCPICSRACHIARFGLPPGSGNEYVKKACCEQGRFLYDLFLKENDASEVGDFCD